MLLAWRLELVAGRRKVAILFCKMMALCRDYLTPFSNCRTSIRQDDY